jgi:hypothetical protein
MTVSAEEQKTKSTTIARTSAGHSRGNFKVLPQSGFARPYGAANLLTVFQNPYRVEASYFIE